MIESVEFKGTITFDIFASAQRIFTGRKWLSLVVIPLMIIGFALPSCQSSLEKTMLLTLSPLSIPLLYIAQKRKWRYYYKNSPYLKEPLCGIVSANSFAIQDNAGKSETPWSRFTKCKARKDIVLLYLGPNVFKIIAKEFFATREDWENARQIVIKGIKNKSTKS